MLLFRRLTISMVLLLLLIAGTGVMGQSANEALVRFAHTIPGASAVDIYVDNILTVSNLSFGQATDYITITPGPRGIRVTPAEASIALWEQTLEASNQGVYTLIATTENNDLAFTIYRDDFTSLPLGRARFTVIHAIPEAPAVDVLLEDGNPVLLAIEYARPDTSGTLDVPVLPYSMVIAPAGGGIDDALAATGPLQLTTGTSHILLVYGTAEQPQAKILTAPTNPAESGGFLRLVHGVPGAPVVDVYVNDTLVSILGSPDDDRNSTEYIAVPAGSYDLAIRATGTQQDLINAAIDIEQDTYLTAIALPDEDGITAALFEDELSGINPDEALIRVINGGAANTLVNASLSDGSFLADNLAGGEASDILAITPAAQELVIGVTIDGGSNIFSLPATTFYGGVFYNLLIVGDDALTLDPVALAQAPGSVPGAELVVVEEATEPEPAEVVDEPEPAVEEPPAPPVVAAQPTIAPDQPQGRVFNLNPDANLQIRLYPDTQAESLGRMPFGTVVGVVGREGELIPNQPATPVPPDYEFVDPADLLEDNEDLPRDETWLRIVYTTPDGGTITGWARSDFIDVRRPDGNRMRLRDLETTPGNVPGRVSDTAISAPPTPQQRVTVTVINLNPDANLNIRRIPSETGDVLGNMRRGESADFVGVNQGQTWIYVSFLNAQGCTVEGWASAEFLDYRFNDAPVEIVELLDRGLFTVVPETRAVPDPVCTGAPPAPAQATPIRDTIVALVSLDPGANLNLRRDPSEASVVLIQVPSGERLLVNGRSADGDWLQVTYQTSAGNFEGWVAARRVTTGSISIFVQLSLNGQPYELEDVPLAPGQIELDDEDDTEETTGG